MASGCDIATDDPFSSINPFFVMEVSQGAAPSNALTLSKLNPGLNGWPAVTNN